MDKTRLNLLLADDDLDDCDFFKDALNEILPLTKLTIVNDGVQLMNFLLLSAPEHYPDIIFLDLNMPRKSGMECISEMKDAHLLNHIPIIIYSTSLDVYVVNRLYEMGAYYYIQKPGRFAAIKKVIEKSIALFDSNNSQQPARDNFVIQS
jgi:DNA-binding NarL/FixJ family response regulator